ncbi:MAG: 4-amino-4-deoxychorismate lyase [Bacteroidetes bacterium]|nr:MAG: 4-amino-4-deoxychorismate lyase [Bacteroidota bacterium]
MNINRAFIYGDLLFETIYVKNNVIRFAEQHFNRLTTSARIIGFDLPANWSLTNFTELIREHFTTGDHRIRFVMHRNGTGFYYPQSNHVKCVVDVLPLPAAHQQIGRIEVYDQQYKSCCSLSNLKSGNALIYVLASVFAQQRSADDALILNQYGNICEASSSNIFVVKNKVVYTPPLAEGPVAGVTREVVMSKLKQQNILVEETPLSVEQLLSADECFLTNSIQGVVGVDRFRSTSFSHHFTDEIRQMIYAQ